MITIVGPTSSGKTSLALKLCKKYNGEIISADSRQLYRKMDIGTGKIPITKSDHNYVQKNKHWIIDGIKIHGYDLCYPNVVFSAGDFAEFFKKKKVDIERRKKTVFLVGGTGLYIDAAIGGVQISNVKRSTKLREKLNNLSLLELQKRLPKETLMNMNNSDINNPRRLIRKIEILNSKNENIGQSKPMYLKDNKTMGLYADRKVLYKRVDYWVDIIWDKLITETKLLILLGYENEFPLKSLMYKTIQKFLKKEINEDEAKEKIKHDLHGYIRRQQTWFNKKENIKWFDIESASFFDDVDKFIA